MKIITPLTYNYSIIAQLSEAQACQAIRERNFGDVAKGTLGTLRLTLHNSRIAQNPKKLKAQRQRIHPFKN